MTASAREWDIAVGTAAVRLGAGLLLLRRRDFIVTAAGGQADDRALRMLFTYFGLRDLTLGVSALAASRPGRDVRRQLVLQGAADSTDAVLVAAAIRRGRLAGWRGRGAVVLAAGTALAEYAAAAALPRLTR